VIVRHYVRTREYRRQLVPYLRRVLWRALFNTNRWALAGMLQVTLGRALRWLPMALKARRLGVRLPMTLQVVDEVACRAACTNCVFTAFSQRGERLDFATLGRLFAEALELGVTIVYLMGADPFYRGDADAFLDLLARQRRQLFFLFTEGKRVTERHLARIRRAGNIVPVLNIDGLREASDRRKGPGSFEVVDALLCAMRDEKMPFIATTMVSRENFEEVTGGKFVRWLDDRGAWMMAYLPYTPMDVRAERGLVMDAGMRNELFRRSLELNRQVQRLVVLDLLGIEQNLTACPAAAYSITVYQDGTVTPCPAATFGDVEGNVHRRSLQEIFVSGRLYSEIRALRRRSSGPLHCLFYTDKEFFRQYLAAHRDTVRVLNPGAVEMLQEEAW
jgi:MoaA/NifB/PqqE/SkfB family radical SAM enzyme